MLYIVSFIGEASKVVHLDTEVDVPFDESEERVGEIILAAQRLKPEIDWNADTCEWDVFSVEHDGIMLNWG